MRSGTVWCPATDRSNPPVLDTASELPPGERAPLIGPGLMRVVVGVVGWIVGGIRLG